MIKNFESLRNPSLSDFRILAIHEIDPDAGFSILNGVITWDKSNKNEKPSDDDIEKKALELQTLHKDLEYARKRKAEYPSIQECVHAILDDDLTSIQEKRKAIKTKYPKS